MPSVKFSSSIGGDAGMKLEGDWLEGSFDRMVYELPTITKKALDTAAFVLKDSIRTQFTNKMPAAGRPFKVPATSKGGYKITKADKLVDAIRQGSADESYTKVYVGNGDSGSPLFIARMYNKDSKDRYALTKNGVKLKNKKFLGKLTGTQYWDDGLATGEQAALNVLENVLDKYIGEAFNG